MTRTSRRVTTPYRTILVAGLATALGTACRPAAPSTAVTPAIGGADSAQYEPSRALGALFGDVQRARVYPDGVNAMCDGCTAVVHADEIVISSGAAAATVRVTPR